MKQLYGKEWQDYVDNKHNQWKDQNPKPKIITIFYYTFGKTRLKKWHDTWETEYKRLGFKWGVDNSTQ